MFQEHSEEMGNPDQRGTAAVEKANEAGAPIDLRPKCAPGVRHFHYFLLFGSLVVAFLQRLNLSVAVVQMLTSVENRVEMGSGVKALVLSSFFWGYGLLQIPLGAAGRRGRAVLLLAAGNATSGLLSLCMPVVAASTGPIGICTLRVLTGLVQGAIYPNVFNLMSKWVIPQEKEACTSFIYSGVALGNLVGTTLAGYLGYHYDWPSIFYASGLLAVLWAAVIYFLGSETPQACKWISPEERDFMEQSFQFYLGKAGEKRGIPPTVPWRQIFTSGPVLAIMVAMLANGWGSWTIATLTPSFISGVLGFDLEDNGLLSSLPHLCSLVLGLLLSYISTAVKRCSGLPDSFLRRLWNSIGQYGSCLGLVGLAFVPQNAGLAVSLLVMCVTINMFSMIGHPVSFLELSNNYTGVLMSFSNTVANFASIAGPLLSTYLINDTSDREQWRVVFLMAAIIFFIGGTVFNIWGSTKRQPWDIIKEEPEL